MVYHLGCGNNTIIVWTIYKYSVSLSAFATQAPWPPPLLCLFIVQITTIVSSQCRLHSLTTVAPPSEATLYAPKHRDKDMRPAVYHGVEGLAYKIRKADWRL